MVDLLAAGHTRRGAAVKVREEFKGKQGSWPSWETLRTHFRELETKGQLPPPSTSTEGRVGAMQKALQERLARINEAKRKLEAAEERAKGLGLDLSGDLNALSAALREQHTTRHDFVTASPDDQARILMARGIRDPEEAARVLAEEATTLELLEQQIDALRAVNHLRPIARSD